MTVTALGLNVNILICCFNAAEIFCCNFLLFMRLLVNAGKIDVKMMVKFTVLFDLEAEREVNPSDNSFLGRMLKCRKNSNHETKDDVVASFILSVTTCT